MGDGYEVGLDTIRGKVMLDIMLRTMGLVPSPNLEFGGEEGEDFKVFRRVTNRVCL